MDFQQPDFRAHGFGDQLSQLSQLNIETPEQVDLRFPVAGIGSRFVALLIDHALQFATYLLVIIGLGIFAAGFAATHPPTGNSGNLDSAGKWFIAIVGFGVFLLEWGYFALFEAYWHGQTPGKRIMKLRVIKDSGRQITLFEALARNLLRFVDLLPGFYLAGVITMLSNKKNKRLGDFAAGTLVVHELAVETHAAVGFTGDTNFFAREDVRVEGGLPADAVARLDATDLHVIETFFTRALDLDLATRQAMATRIVEKMAAKMKVAVPEGNPERALEEMARGLRGSGKRF